MAVDEALLSAPHSGWTLRFYGWHRPTVSLGYAQPFDRGVDVALAQRLAIPLVRRPTGGRAVLHAGELTYSIAAPADTGALAGGVSTSYRRIAAGLRAGLGLLGAEVEVERSGAAPVPAHKGPCFSARTRYELSVGGRKLVGSAQRRRDGRLLQHGSILLDAPDRRLWGVLGEGSRQAADVSVGLHELLAVRPTRRALVACLAEGIADALGMPVLRSQLAVAERRTARGLCARYRDPQWTRRH
jgi:lipoate-protein ligase A